MSRAPENLRARRTRVLLRAALVELVEARGFDRVTVGQICERAMVSRAAFYRHYRDKYQLVEQIFDEAAYVLTDEMATPDGPDPVVRLQRFFDHVARYDRLYRVLLGPKGSPWFANRIHSTFTAMLDRHVQLGAATHDLVATVLGGMLTHALTWWLDHDRPLTSTELAEHCATLAGAVVTQARAGSPRDNADADPCG